MTDTATHPAPPAHPIPQPLIAHPARQIAGAVTVPGDKSISHRSLILGTLAVGETRITGLLEGEDVIRTGDAMRAFGADITRHDDGTWSVYGVGIGTLLEPPGPLDFGNSGTGVRLVLGMVAGHGITAIFDGDASLRKRPMSRVLLPLQQIGARIIDSQDGRLPLTLSGARDPLPITYELPVASAQVKSAVLLAGLNAPGITSVIEPVFTRDHTERMLRFFGAKLDIDLDDQGHRHIALTGRPDLVPGHITVPADPSSAAYPMVAGLIAPDGEVRLDGVMINETRSGLLTTLLEMGADIDVLNQRDLGGEPVADLTVRPSRLKPIDVPPERAPSMIDEYPALAVAASFTNGTTRMRGLHELRVKESDRLEAVAAGLEANGVTIEIEGDDLIVHGTGTVPGGGTVKTHLDHRIAMSFLVMGIASTTPVAVDDGAMIATSFPNFVDLMTGLGASIEQLDR